MLKQGWQRLLILAPTTDLSSMEKMEPYKGVKCLVRDYSKCMEWDLL